MTVKDIKRVDQLKVFTEFTINQLYPEVRSSSDESSFFTYDKEYDHEEDSKDKTLVEPADDPQAVKKPLPYKMTMINSFNYFCGMKISIWEAKMETNFQN